jgi:elongation factor G
MPHQVQDIRNILFCGHGSSGKTTLADAILSATGAVKRQGSVDDGTSICDFDEEERVHHNSVESTLVHFDHAGKHFNLIDTPGYPDLIGQVLGAMHAVDTAVIVIDAHSGLGVNTRRTFHEAGKRGLGRIIAINKLDADNVDYPALLATIQELFGSACIPFNLPLGHGAGFQGVASVLDPPPAGGGVLLDPKRLNESLIEAVIEVDDAVTERYFEGTLPTAEEVSRLIVEAVAGGTLIPVVCVSAKTGRGLTELLDALAQCALPADKLVRKGKNEAGAEVEIKPTANGPLTAHVFKTRIDPFVHKLSFIRIFSGKMKKDDSVHVSGARKAVKLHQLLEVQANETHPIDEASAGEIVAVAKVDELHTGLSLGDVELPAIKFPTPMVGLAVTPKSRGDEGKLSGALHKIVEEDSTIQLHRDPQTHELVMNGMSELHLSLIRERLKRRDKPAAAASSARCTSGCFRFPPMSRPRNSAPRHGSPACASFTTTPRTTFCGSIRSSAARFPTTSCRRSRKDSRNAWIAA